MIWLYGWLILSVIGAAWFSAARTRNRRMAREHRRKAILRTLEGE